MSDRARQFMPFDALKGHKEAIKSMERIETEKHELFDDDINRLTYVIRSLKKGMNVTVIHYDKDAYIKTTGLVSEVNILGRYIRVVKTYISFDDINDITCSDIPDYDSFYNI